MGVRLAAHEHIVLPLFFFPPFSCSTACMTDCARLAVDPTYVGCLHMFTCLFHCVITFNFVLFFPDFMLVFTHSRKDDISKTPWHQCICE